MNRSSITTTLTEIRGAAGRVAAALVAAVILVATAIPAKAIPPVMPVGGQWDIVQSNGFRVTVNLDLDGPNITGDGQNITGTARTSGLTSNNVTGTVNNHHIHLDIPWTPGDSVGSYDGELTPNRFSLPGAYLNGSTQDKTHLESTATWYSENLALSF